MATEFLELRQDSKNVSQYDQKFTQLSRYADTLVRSEADKTKRFVKGLRSDIRGRLIPLQLRNYLQAVERALEVEMDIQEGQGEWVEEMSNSKRPRYQEPPMRTASVPASSRGSGFNTSFYRGGGARGGRNWLRNRDTASKTQATPASYSRVTETPWLSLIHI